MISKLNNNKPVLSRTINGSAISYKTKKNVLETKLSTIESSLPNKKTELNKLIDKEND